MHRHATLCAQANIEDSGDENFGATQTHTQVIPV